MLDPFSFSKLLAKMWNSVFGKTRMADKEYKKIGTLTREDIKNLAEAKTSIEWFSADKEGVVKCSLW